MSDFGRELRRRRKAKHHSQGWLADKLGTYMLKISRLENGANVRLTDEQLATLRDLYGHDLPPYGPRSASENVLLDELEAVANKRALVVSSRSVGRFAMALALIQTGRAIAVYDEMVTPLRGPRPMAGDRIPYRRIMLMLAETPEGCI